MKIALILRGIPRYKPYDLGRHLLNKLIIDRFPDCEFRVITQIPTLIEDVDLKKEKNYKSIFCSKILNTQECDEIVQGYQPDYHMCTTFVEAFRAAKKYSIMKHNQIDDINKIHSTLTIFNDLCQHVNYLHSKRALISYANDNAWYPDLILNIRYDSIHFFENSQHMKIWKENLDNLKLQPIAIRPLQYEFQSNIDQYVYPSIIEYHKDKLWMADWTFYETYSEDFFKRSMDFDVQQQADNMVMQDLFDRYTKESLQTSHFYWHCVFADYIIRSLPDSDSLHRTTLIRKNDPIAHKAFLNTNDTTALKNRFFKITAENKSNIIKQQAKPSEHEIMLAWNFYNTVSEELK